MNKIVNFFKKMFGIKLDSSLKNEKNSNLERTPVINIVQPNPITEVYEYQLDNTIAENNIAIDAILVEIPKIAPLKNAVIIPGKLKKPRKKVTMKKIPTKKIQPKKKK